MASGKLTSLSVDRAHRFGGQVRLGTYGMAKRNQMIGVYRQRRSLLAPKEDTSTIIRRHSFTMPVLNYPTANTDWPALDCYRPFAKGVTTECGLLAKVHRFQS